MSGISLISRKSLAHLLVGMLLVSEMAAPYAAALEYMSGPNNGYVGISSVSSYAPTFQLDTPLNFGDRFIATLMNWSSPTSSGFYAGIGFETTGSLPGFDFSSLPDGTYGMSGTIKDNVDSEVRSGIDGIFTLDTVLPVIVSTGTLSSDSGSITLDGASATDLHFDSASLTYSWVAGATENGNISLVGTALSLSGRITGLSSNSSYDLTVTFRDLAGNTTNASLGTYMTTSGPSDTTPPVITLDSHTTGQTVTGGTVTLTGSVTDAGIIDSVVVNGQTGSVVGNDWSLTFSSLSAWTNLIEAVATDNAGNTGSVSINLIRIPDVPSSVTSSASGTDRNISFTTDLVATGVVLYGTNSGSLDMSATGATESWSHVITLSSLTTGQTYYYQTYTLAGGYSGGLSTLSSFSASCAIPSVANGIVDTNTCAISCNVYFRKDGNSCVFIGGGSSSTPTIPKTETWATATGKTIETQTGTLDTEKELNACKVPLGERGVPKILPEYANVTFTDISDSPNKDLILRLARRWAFILNEDNTFSPNEKATRQELIAAVGRLEGWDISKYINNKPRLWENPQYYPYYLASKWSKIKNLCDWTKWCMFHDFTRAEISRSIYGVISARNVKLNTVTLPFKDLSWESRSVKNDISRLYSVWIVKWMTPTTFDPRSYVTKEQLAVFLARSYCLDYVSDEPIGWTEEKNTGSWETSTGVVNTGSLNTGSTLPTDTNTGETEKLTKYSWDVGDYGACTESVQTRSVRCLDTQSDRIVNAALCSETKPTESRSCTIEPDPTTTKNENEFPLPETEWVVVWKQNCSEENSSDDRTILCKRWETTVDDKFCTKEKPKLSACKYGEWSAWPYGSCAFGTQTREVSCMLDGEAVLGKNCESSTRPSSSMSCETTSGDWILTSSSKCSIDALMTKEYACFKDGAKVADEECTTDKPETSVSCSEPPTVTPSTYRWKLEWTRCQIPWGSYERDPYRVSCVNDEWTEDDTQCKADEKPKIDACYNGDWSAWPYESCSLGVHTRSVSCMYNRQTVDDVFCDPAKKPTETIACVANVMWTEKAVWLCNRWVQEFEYVCTKDGKEVSDSLCDDKKPLAHYWLCVTKVSNTSSIGLSTMINTVLYDDE
jgi:Thrombospondin type 1 domain